VRVLANSRQPYGEVGDGKAWIRGGRGMVHRAWPVTQGHVLGVL